MATIGSLAIKIQADLNGLLSGAADTIRTIDNIAKSAKNATPAMKNFEDSAQALGTMLDVVAEAKEKFNSINKSSQDIDEINKALEGYEKARDATEQVFGAVVKNTKATVDELKTLPPTFENVEKGLSALNDALHYGSQAITEMSNSGLSLNMLEFDENIMNLGTTVEDSLNKIAVSIGQIEPKFKNSTEALNQFEKVWDNVATLQMTMDNNIGAETINKAQRSFADYFNKVAESMDELPPTMDNLKQSFESFNILVQKRNELSNLGRDVTEMDDSISNFRDSLRELAYSKADEILNMRPTIESLYNAQKEVNKLIELRDELLAEGQTNAASLLNNVIEQANDNVSQLASNVAEAKSQMTMFQSTVFAINNFPFSILSNQFQNIYESVQEYFEVWNENLYGTPGKIVKVIAIMIALASVIGLCTVKMTALNGAASFFTMTIKSTAIYQGLANLIPVLGTMVFATWNWAAAQWGVNSALTVTLGLIGAIMTMLVIGLVIAAIAAVIWWIVSLGESAEETARRIEETEKSTEAFRDAIGEAVDRYKELNNLAKQYHDDNLTDLQKYENKLEEINEVLNRNETANSIMEQLNAKEAELQAIFDNSNSKKERESLQKQIDDLQKDREGLEKEMRKSPVISEADAAAAREKARLAMLESRFGDLLKQALTPQQEYADAISELVELTEKGIVTEAEQQLIKENAVKKLIDSLGIEKLIEVPKTAQNTYNEYFKKLQIAIDEAVITLEQYNIGLENAAKLLADDLGISEWVGTKNTKTLQQAYNDIAIYAQKVAMSMKEEAAARDRARAAFEKQSEYYNLYQKAKDALTPMADRIKEVNKKIDKEAAVFGWSKDVTDKMKALAEAEMNQVKESKRENQILTKGSTAYTDYQNKNIQNDHLKSIRDNSKKQVDFAQKTVEAVKSGFSNLEKCFEVIG